MNLLCSKSVLFLIFIAFANNINGQGFDDNELINREIIVSEKSPDGMSNIYGDLILMTEEERPLFLKNGLSGKTTIIVKNAFRRKPIIIWHESDVVEVIVRTGSPGRYSIFYDLRNDRISEEIWFPICYDPSRKIVLTGEEELKLLNPFYNKLIMNIQPNDIMLTAINYLVVKNAKFDSHGNLIIRYINNKNKIKELTIKNDEIQTKINALK